MLDTILYFFINLYVEYGQWYDVACAVLLVWVLLAYLLWHNNYYGEKGDKQDPKFIHVQFPNDF